jgi:peptidoglycan/LPS O-acetylase OafA/YrhL
MGFLRFFLAMSVVISHTTAPFGLQLMTGAWSVWIFFMISGFYMSMVLTGKYSGLENLWLFYSNRFLRLYPSYIAAVILTAIVAVFSYYKPGAPQQGAVVTEILEHAQGRGEIGLASLIGIIFANISLIGSDILFMLFRPLDGSNLFFLLGDREHATRLGGYLLVGPAWSLGIELWFYALIPFMIRWKIWILAVIAMLSFALQMGMDHFYPWSSYFFFPANLWLFLLGSIGFKLWNNYDFINKIKRNHILFIATASIFCLVFREFIPFFRNYFLLVGGLAAVSIPFLFEATKNSEFDKWLGNLSFPLYVFHAAVMMYFENFWHTQSFVYIASASITISLLSIMLIENPIDRLRAARVARRR